MILEIADIHVEPSRQLDFEKAVTFALANIFPNAKGFRGHQFRRCIETPGRYVLLLEWESLEDHTVSFRSSALYGEWRGLVGHFFAKPPHVEHFELIGGSTD